MYDSMKRTSFYLVFTLACILSFGQDVSTKLNQAFMSFEKDSQLRSAITSLYVIDAKNGEVLFDKNADVGLAPASTQKIITSTTAYELLGKDFCYTTEFGYTGSIDKNVLNGNITIKGSGDPTFGSWRWKQTSEEEVLNRIVHAIKGLHITRFQSLVFDENGWEDEAIPDGWIWQDIGNYYGAGAEKLIWRENQFDMILRSGKNIGDPVIIVQTKPELYSYSFNSFATSAAKGTGDNSYIYFSINNAQGVVRGTIPVNEDHFVISGAMPSGKYQFVSTLSHALKGSGIHNAEDLSVKDRLTTGGKRTSATFTVFHRERSPDLDSITYWFLKKSINLYGEALLKTMAYQKKGSAMTDKGVEIIKDFWKEKGIASTELNIVDGSGLSPLNRVTTHAQVTILNYARRQPWFNGFYFALPECNGMKMKSGSFNGV